MGGINRVLIAGLLSFALTASARAQESTWHPEPTRGASGATCPPAAPVQNLPQDKDLDGNGKTDRYIGEFRWDDKKGNDFKVEVWCMDGAYFSVRVFQSTNKAETLVGTPGGKDVTSGATGVDTGMC